MLLWTSNRFPKNIYNTSGLSISLHGVISLPELFYSSSRYLDDLLNIDNHDFQKTVGQIYPTEFQLLSQFIRFARVCSNVDDLNNKAYF